MRYIALPQAILTPSHINTKRYRKKCLPDWVELEFKLLGHNSGGRTKFWIDPGRQYGSAQRCSARVFLPATPPRRDSTGKFVYRKEVVAQAVAASFSFWTGYGGVGSFWMCWFVLGYNRSRCCSRCWKKKKEKPQINTD